MGENRNQCRMVRSGLLVLVGVLGVLVLAQCGDDRSFGPGSAGEGGVGGEGGSSGGSGGAGPTFELMELGYVVESEGTDVAVTIDAAVPAGASVVALVAGRGTSPCSVTDTAGHMWSKLADLTNAADVAFVAAFLTVATEGFGTSNEIIAKASFMSSWPRALLIMQVPGYFADVDDAQNTGAPLSAATSQQVSSANAVILAVTATGDNLAATYDTASDHQLLHNYSTSFSSGAFFLIDAATLVDSPALFSATKSHNTGHSASAVVLFQ